MDTTFKSQMVWIFTAAISFWIKNYYKTGIFCSIDFFIFLVVPRSGGQDSTLEETQVACSHTSSPCLYGQSALCTGRHRYERIFIIYESASFSLYALVLGI